MGKANVPMMDCPGCGVILPSQEIQRAHGYNASGECYEKYSALTAYTLNHKGDRFIRQHVVDAYAAQHAGNGMRNITMAFALIGLFYAVEHGFSGRQVQRIHTLLGGLKHSWDTLPLPQQPYSVNIIDVLREPPGDSRDAMIGEWMRDVWGCWSDQQEWVRSVCKSLLD